ncbi:MAG: endonuclease IV [Ruminococcaceae bacterium]|nr:endonuclease IV [Oscillospiraceae bacterium]
MSNRALFGPGGNSESFYAAGNKSTKQAPKWLYEIGLDAYEYQCGNGVTGSDANFIEVGSKAKEYGIAMSLHAPYFISLSGVETEKRLKSIDYIRKSVHAAELLGADRIVIHTGSASKITRAEALALASDTILRALEEIETDVKFGLETMGKINQLGTLDEVIELCKISPRLIPVVDFGHLNARDLGNVFVTEDDYKRVFDKIGSSLGDDVAKNLHCHFSKIEFTGGGEKKHLTFTDTVYGPEFSPLAKVLYENNLTPRIICESAGTMAEDALEMKKMYIGASDV